MTQKAFAVAIDGPVASGKGTIARLLAAKLHGFHLNTGLMYRALTLYCLQHAIDMHNAHEVTGVLSGLLFSLEDDKIYMNGQDVTEDTKTPIVTEAVPIVAAIGEVRVEMVKRQHALVLQKIGEGQIVLIDGRDAATKIFPDARLKIFLTATPEVRAQRRLDQLGGGDYQQTLVDIKKRDYQDTHRETTPLVSDPLSHGYLVIDTSSLTENDTIALILRKINKNDTN